MALATIEALVHMQRIDPRRIALALDLERLGVGQRGLESHRIDVGEIVRDGALRLQGGAGTGHRDVEGFIHGTPGIGNGESGIAKAGLRGLGG